MQLNGYVLMLAIMGNGFMSEQFPGDEGLEGQDWDETE